jgi:hypothetical protein
MTTNFVTVEEFKEQSVGVDLSRYTDTTISGMLTRATAKAESFLNYTLPIETIVNEKKEGVIDINRDFVISTDKMPVRSLSSLTVQKGTFTSTVSLTDGSGNNRYDIPSTGNIIFFQADAITFDSISLINVEALRYERFFTQITYEAGYHMYDRPQDIVDAIVLIAQDEVARAQNQAGASELRQGGVTIKYANQTRKDTHKSDKILDAEAILTPYQRLT